MTKEASSRATHVTPRPRQRQNSTSYWVVWAEYARVVIPLQDPRPTTHDPRAVLLTRNPIFRLHAIDSCVRRAERVHMLPRRLTHAGRHVGGRPRGRCECTRSQLDYCLEDLFRSFMFMYEALEKVLHANWSASARSTRSLRCSRFFRAHRHAGG